MIPGKIWTLLNRMTRHKSLLSTLLNGSSILEKLDKLMKQRATAILLYVDVADFHQVVQIQGDILAKKVLNTLSTALHKHAGQFVLCSGELLVEHIWGDDFIVLCRLKEGMNQERLHKMSTAMRIALEEAINGEMYKLSGATIKLHVGYSLIPGKPCKKPDKVLYAALKEAQKVAKGNWQQQTVHLLEEFNNILARKDLTIVYQPIVNLNTGEVLGWEALTRGPKDSYFLSPAVIFNFAEEVGLLFPLEKICRELAIKNIGPINKEQKLFLNIHPFTVNDPNFVKGETIKLLSESALKANNLIFEITERQSINDFSQFNKTMSHYRNQGYRIAVDDAGAGFSSLQAIAEVRPDYIKFDHSLIRDINTNRVKQALLETLVTFAEKIGCSIIAEGIETEAELGTLKSIGIHYGQGYFIARPSFPKPLVSTEALNKIYQLASLSPSGSLKSAFPIGEITEPAVEVSLETPVRRLKEIFDANELLNGVVITNDGQPEGMIMRHHINRFLGTQYGVALYFERPVAAIMDADPLVVDINLPIEQVSQLAMNRDKLKLYDYIVVIRDKQLDGVVSVQTLLDTMTKVRMELAKGANPLTGLPGNLAIEKEINSRLMDNSPFSSIYVDLDNFKSYNDRYGFEHGDKLILLAARLLCSVVKKYGSANDFIGHIGGDDFIVLSQKESTEEISRRYIRLFDRLVKGFYAKLDREAGGFWSTNRQGQETWFPLISVSLALVDCAGCCTPEELAERAAQVKNYAKTLPGSVYVKDRRKINCPELPRDF